MSKACRNHKIPAGLFLVQEFRAVSSREFQKAHSPSSAPPDAGRLVISAPGHGVGVYDNGCAAGVTAKLQSPLPGLARWVGTGPHQCPHRDGGQTHRESTAPDWAEVPAARPPGEGQKSAQRSDLPLTTSR